LRNKKDTWNSNKIKKSKSKMMLISYTKTCQIDNIMKNYEFFLSYICNVPISIWFRYFHIPLWWTNFSISTPFKLSNSLFTCSRRCVGRHSEWFRLGIYSCWLCIFDERSRKTFVRKFSHYITLKLARVSLISRILPYICQ